MSLLEASALKRKRERLQMHTRALIPFNMVNIHTNNLLKGLVTQNSNKSVKSVIIYLRCSKLACFSFFCGTTTVIGNWSFQASKEVNNTLLMIFIFSGLSIVATEKLSWTPGFYEQSDQPLHWKELTQKIHESGITSTSWTLMNAPI